MSFEELSKNLNLSSEAVQAIPEELRTEKSLEPMKDLPGLLKSYVDGQKMIGGSIRIPKEDAKPEEMDAFYTKLGRPAKAEEYKYTLPYPEHIVWNDERIKDFTTVAHKMGFNNKQVQEVLNWYGEVAANEIQDRKKSFEESVTTLKSDWGAGFDRNLALAKRVRDLYGGEEAKAFFADDPLGNNPVLVRMLAKIGADLEEGDYLGGPGESTGLTPEEAKSKILEVQRNPEDIYHSKFANKPGHNERVKEVEGWYQIAYGSI